MTDIMKFNDSVTITIPDIGYIIGGMILGKIDDITVSPVLASYPFPSIFKENFT